MTIFTRNPLSAHTTWKFWSDRVLPRFSTFALDLRLDAAVSSTISTSLPPPVPTRTRRGGDGGAGGNDSGSKGSSTGGGDEEVLSLPPRGRSRPAELCGSLEPRRFDRFLLLPAATVPAVLSTTAALSTYSWRGGGAAEEWASGSFKASTRETSS